MAATSHGKERPGDCPFATAIRQVSSVFHSSILLKWHSACSNKFD